MPLRVSVSFWTWLLKICGGSHFLGAVRNRGSPPHPSSFGDGGRDPSTEGNASGFSGACREKGSSQRGGAAIDGGRYPNRGLRGQVAGVVAEMFGGQRPRRARGARGRRRYGDGIPARSRDEASPRRRTGSMEIEGVCPRPVMCPAAGNDGARLSGISRYAVSRCDGDGFLDCLGVWPDCFLQHG